MKSEEIFCLHFILFRSRDCIPCPLVTAILQVLMCCAYLCVFTCSVVFFSLRQLTEEN
jgi:hypothetical protein